MAWGLWRTYGPGVIATAAAYMGPTANTPQTHQPLNLQQPPPPPPSTSTSTSSGYSLSDTASLIARRKQLEAELANLPAASPLPPAPSQVPMTPSSTYLPPPGEEGVNGSNGAGRYEQIERHEVEGITDTANQPRGWFGGWTGSGAPSPSAGDKSKTE
jgi:receptor expression-enhancing protein 1/2/3/4